jgi:hypothetical protein
MKKQKIETKKQNKNENQPFQWVLGDCCFCFLGWVFIANRAS